MQKKVKEDTHVMGVRIVLMAIMERLDRVESKPDRPKVDGLEAKVDRMEAKINRVEERLSLLEESCSAVRATVERPEIKNVEVSKTDKYGSLYYEMDKSTNKIG